MTTMFNTGDLISRLEGWYVSQCNGTWEHGAGVSLQTLDNPGWSLAVDIAETEWANRPFSRMRIDRSEHNWLQCWLENGRFHAVGGPLNLREMIETFLWFVDPFYDPSALPGLSTMKTRPLGEL